MKTERYRDAKDALRALSDYLVRLMDRKEDGVFTLALSGGETARQLFSLWAEEYKTQINWEKICFYWVDERCVPKTDNESNFAHANRLLFQPLQISKSHYHRIKGENYPPAEAKRYSSRVKEHVPECNGLPRFDCIILGVGADAHTASLFPDSPDLLTEKQPYAVARHPQTGQLRVTMTGPLILNDTPLLVPVLGKGKEDVIKQLEAGYVEEQPTPATYILSKAKEAILFITEE